MKFEEQNLEDHLCTTVCSLVLIDLAADFTG